MLAFAVTSAPLMMNALNDMEFIFNCDHNFADRYTGEADYFVAKEKQPENEGQWNSWETNFVPDLRTAFLGDYRDDGKVEGGRVMGIMMADGWASLHTSWWPAGKYHKAHYHGPGAILLGLKSEGYVLMWPKHCGIHPYQDGYGDKVIKMNWKPNGIYSPCSEWFHQHFNTGPEIARHLAVKGGGIGFDLPSFRGTNYVLSIREEGGTIIEYEDEDPQIRRMFEEEVRQKGGTFTMKPVVYRTDPLPYKF